MFKLLDHNFDEIQLDNITPLDIEISSISKEKTQEESSLIGYREYGSISRDRDISITFLIDNEHTRSYRKIRSDTYDLLGRYEYFYVVETYRPDVMYKVSANESYTPERLNRSVASFEVALDIYETPYGQTDKLIKFEDIANTSFTVINEGHKLIHPFDPNVSLKITLSNFSGSAGLLRLTNELNNSETAIGGDLSVDDVVEIDGASIRINDANAFNRSNQRYLQISRGANKVIVRGVESCHVKVEFRELYN